jgi:hypothetical protein
MFRTPELLFERRAQVLQRLRLSVDRYSAPRTPHSFSKWRWATSCGG